MLTFWVDFRISNMPLTAAEKSKRYREKIKNDPEKHEAFKKKELERQKKHQKKIKELTEEEKNEKRRRWRAQKQKQKEKKKNSQPQPQPQTSAHLEQNQSNTTVTRSFKIRYKKIRNNYNKALNKVRQCQIKLESLRKKLYRMKNKYESEINFLSTENSKLKARQEILEISLRHVYGTCNKTKDKQLLKTIVLKQASALGKAPKSNILGLKGRIRKRTNTKLPINKKLTKKLLNFI